MKIIIHNIKFGGIVYQLFIFLLIASLSSCNRQIVNKTEQSVLEKYNPIMSQNEDTHDLKEAIDHFDFNSVTLKYGMSREEIAIYYKAIDQLIDIKDNTIVIPSVNFTEELNEKIKRERSDKSKYYSDNVQLFYSANSSYYYSASPINPNGYINFNNYHYRKSQKNLIPNLYAIVRTNEEPLKLSYGLLFFKKDVPVYSDDMNNPIGLLKSGSVILLRGVQLDRKTISFFANVSLQYVRIKFEDVPLISELLERVSYKLINGKVYRIIDNIQTEIIATIYSNAEGIRYIRSDNSTQLMNGFYCWEYQCDIYFDERGDFLKYGYDENYGK